MLSWLPILVGSLFAAARANDSCKILGCGNHSSVCWCQPSCFAHADCCNDYEQVCPQVPPSVKLRDLNLVVTTDIHSWIEGRIHEPHLNATLGHAVSLVEHLRALGRAQRRDVFFFDNGDINDGTGLSATSQDHVAYLAPLMRKAPYDALNMGNHELYQLNSRGAIPGEACAIAGLNNSGYISAWDGRYLTSNTVWADSGEPVGSRFTILEGSFGTRLLVFGFLYNMEDHCDKVRVEDVATVVKSSWFTEALREHAAGVDAIVVLAHMDFRDSLVDTILQATRNVVGKRKPVQFLTGHSHIRGWRRTDKFSSSYEAGCKMDTVGVITFDRSSASRIWFEYADIDGNTAHFAKVGNTTNLLEPVGSAVNDAIAGVQDRLRLRDVAGHADRRYRVEADFSEPDSLWAYYMHHVLPGVLFESGSARTQLAVVGNGALSYDIFEGPFTIDDAYKTSPFGNYWFTLRGVAGSALVTMLNNLNKAARTDSRQLDSRRHVAITFGLSGSFLNYYATGSPDVSTIYDLIYCDFDAAAIEEQLENITGHVWHRELFRVGSNTSSVLVDWFRKGVLQAPQLLV